MTLTEHRTRLERRKGQRDLIQLTLDQALEKRKELRKSLKRHIEAREIIHQAGLKTQETLSIHISDITSLALKSVFEEKAYDLVTRFVRQRNQTECVLMFSREGQEVKPLDSSGGGAVDIASLALRVASWSMETPRKRNTMILDEPLKNLDVRRIDLGSFMLKEISEKLKIQEIIVTHEDSLTAAADRVFEIRIRKGKSYTRTNEM